LLRAILLCSHFGFSEWQDWSISFFMTRDWNYPQTTVSLPGQATLQMRTIAYNDEAAPWSRSNHLMRTRLLPSSNNNLSQNLCRTRTKITINQATLGQGCLILHTSLPLPQFFLYLKPKGHVSILKLSWNASLPLPTGNWYVIKCPFSDLHHYSSLQLTYWGKWQNLTYWNPKSCASDRGLWLQNCW
jgi:hypothetical protein